MRNPIKIILGRSKLRFLFRLADLAQEKQIRKLMYQKRLLDIVASVNGDIVECGVGWGRSLLIWALLASEEGKGRRIWGFDSFKGFPEFTDEDIGMKAPKKGRWCINIKDVVHLLSSAGFDVAVSDANVQGINVEAQVILVKGFFRDTLHNYTGPPIALLHIDADIYSSYMDALTELYPKVAVGGVIAFDEYSQPGRWPGAKKAVDEYFGDKVSAVVTDSRFGKCYLIKREGDIKTLWPNE